MSDAAQAESAAGDGGRRKDWARVGADSTRATRIAIEAWAPEYGAPIDAEMLAPSDAAVDTDVEVPAALWRPIDPSSAGPAREVAFVDGVRRIDARVWITGEDGTTRMGICASYGAGVVICSGTTARITAAEVRRGLFAPAGAPDLHTRAGAYAAIAVASDDMEQLSQGLQERMARLEREIAAARHAEPAAGDGSLLVVDGPLTGKLELEGAVGYVKTHHVAYLPEGLSGVVAALRPGQRSPLFLTQGGRWSRFSWYLRLDRAAGHPWAGIVRCEVSATLAPTDVGRLAGLCCTTLPRFASAPHKDPRAPQNLYPIAGLERELRRRLGDSAWVYRALRVAAGPSERR